MNQLIMYRCIHLCIGLFLATHCQSTEVTAQSYNPNLERQLIREASSHEGRGNLEEAERVLRIVLSANPTSDVGLLAAERVFREQGTLEEILPLVDSYLEIDSSGSVARNLALMVYQDLGDLDKLKKSAEDWLIADGNRAEPYRKISEIFLESYGEEEALEILERGERLLKEPSQFALTIGDLLMELGRYDSAAIAWAKGIGNDGSQTSAVIRRVVAIGGKEQGSIELLLEELVKEPTTTARVRAATRIALEAGLVIEALDYAEVALRGLEGQTRRGFLTVLAREAEEVKGGARASLWAYEAMRDQALDATEIKALNYRIVSTALEAGDTLRALEAQYAVADALPEGNSERRRALAEGLRMGVMKGTAERLGALKEFTAEFPDALEVDELSVLLAITLDLEGQEAVAKSLLEGVEGPRSDLERGYIHLVNDEIDMAESSLMAALSGLPPHQATEILSLLNIMGRLQGTDLAIVVRAAVLKHRGLLTESLSILELGLRDAGQFGKPTLLSFSAYIAQEAGMNDRAAEFRADIVKDYSESYEFPAAALELARYKGASENGRAEAIVILENLIISRPNSALAPLARRELQLLGRL